MGALPQPVEDALNRALVAEFTVVAPSGRPITHPMIPIYDGERIYLHSSVLFSRKVEHVRRNPKVSLSISDLSATHGEPLTVRVTVQGDARVFDEDPHTTWERILPLWIAKEPIVKEFYAKRVALPLFWERALIEVAPRRVLMWEDGRTDRPPQVFELAGVA
ncbi:MAG TPA: pyridoxamine 5'-phosphate oxidase family protein [Actinomycetota bacterium]|nr:pyridoxamine 5'-phosphate oxidase family protein [Actinomycetota bacterium]